jgi:hypothetical protein
MKKMKKSLYGIAALAVVGLFMSAGIVVADVDDEEIMTGAGGGGWFKVNEAKDTFGFYLNASDITMSELVLQARDAGVTVHAYQFDNIVFNYDATLGTGSAEAWGMAYVAGVEASFHLIVEDNGGRSLDRLMLEVSGDYTNAWDITGLGGGQIWVYLE